MAITVPSGIVTSSVMEGTDPEAHDAGSDQGSTGVGAFVGFWLGGIDGDLVGDFVGEAVPSSVSAENSKFTSAVVNGRFQSAKSSTAPTK